MIAQLNDLLDAELNSVFAFLGHSTPYLDRAHASMRKTLAVMVASSERRAARLAALIESLEGSPIPRGMRASEQHLAYLTIQFLLPKLITAKQQDIRRYQEARPATHGNVVTELDQMIEEQVVELRTLNESKL